MNPHKQRTLIFVDDAAPPTQKYRLRYTYKRGKWSLTSWQGADWKPDHWKHVRNFGIGRYRRWASAGVPMEAAGGVYVPSIIHSKGKNR